ncbi:MAG: glutamate--tRNA ligase [Candidatus Nealsonbacteria bacterium RIFCSPLOWO2_01_FULL_43_36]|uniref:Glutamate--tRNA ligase n=1 Tax=Candidatus Nealsonbacteria bacterium RIFCSPHIGHO2_02_FULL_43_13 TaxID=1801668 RepID=A0A1G2E952_9BACT|nr:MAG: glutamate--tRNA ligase [Candidatus Nealsonbacteria bacterium RIFCSPHIGHO2_02_FULL_43_13]OGZ25329.1 MAG: glutamate--tRNA ligase [Candidatus Nealsonbacteria bacterium RIFCSPLOWO2_01_FULL_43_36]
MSIAEAKSKEIRVRIAPSPTGFLHVGTARAALFNYLFAKHESGKFILRIEDTDLERSSPKFEKDIIESLKWLGIAWDEGPSRQSDRIEIYTKYLKTLLKENKAYYCFCSEEELEAVRQDQLSRGLAPRYNGKCRSLTETEIKKRLTEGESAIIRFKTHGEKVSFNDLIRGKIEFDTSLIGDFTIAKDLTTPLYNFAVVVDDFEMKISHIIRGEDHIPNTPKQILIQQALGLPQPQYAHLPLILGPDRSKLSKRHAAVSVANYREEGYLPEALINFMVFLGWNPGTDQEIYSLTALSQEFTLEKVQKSGAVFNLKRLDYLNGFYIRQKPLDELTELCRPYLPASPAGGPKAEKDFLKKVVGLHQERLKKLSEITELADFFFQDKLNYDKELLRWKDADDQKMAESLDNLDNLLSEISERNWAKENLEKVLMARAEKIKDRGYLLWPLRVALAGKKASAGPIEIAAILGKEKTLTRLKEARALIV